jgi:MFS transporter, ACDE family, multidrug resistance protein
MHESEKEQPGDKVYRDPNLQIIFCVTLLAIIGVASITPAFPRIIQAFGISAHKVALLITAFNLPGVLLTPFLGLLADRFGRKEVLVPSLFLFSLAGVACGFTRSFDHLLILRFVQGMGGASLGSLNATLIGDLFRGRRRTAAVGYNSSVLSIGTAICPALGGALAMLGWYYPFFLPALALPLGLVVIYRLKNPRLPKKKSLGVYLKDVWLSVRNPQALALFAASTLTFIILYGSYLAFFPLLLNSGFGAPAYVIGLIMSSMSLANALTSFQMVRLTSRFSTASLLRIACVLYIVALVMIPFTPKLGLFLVPTTLFGIAMGLNTPIMVNLLTGLAPVEHRAGFMSMNGLVLRLGQTLGPLVMGFFFQLWGLRGVYFAGAGVSLVLLLLVGAMTGGAARRGKSPAGGIPLPPME